MSAELDNQEQLQRLQHFASASMGSYLKLVHYSSAKGHLCPICGGLKSAKYPYCWSCQNCKREASKQGQEGLLANRVGISAYAVESEGQFYKTMWNYKDSLSSYSDARSNFKNRSIQKDRHDIETIMQLALCNEYFSEMQIDYPAAWAIVPSTSSSRRYKHEHPLHTIVKRVFPDLPEVPIQAVGKKMRVFDPSIFRVDAIPTSLTRHVLLIDDSWVTGGTVQSAAAALKLAGAQEVSIYCIARILNIESPYWQRDKELIAGLKQFLHQIDIKPNYNPWLRPAHHNNS